MKAGSQIGWIAVLFGTLILFTGCATVTKGTTQRINISSDPPGAKVTIDDIPAGETPTSIELSCASTHKVRVQKEGYLPLEETLSQTTSGMVAGNIIAGGLVGICIDAATGGMYNLTPESISAKLVKAASPSESNAAKPEMPPVSSTQATTNVSGVADKTSNP